MSVPPKLTIRYARTDDIPALAELSTWPREVWQGQSPPRLYGWLIAHLDGAPVGCVNVLPGWPVARIEGLAVVETLSARDKHAVMLRLSRVAAEFLRRGNVPYVAAFVGFGSKGIKRAFKRRFGAVVQDSGNMLLTRLNGEKAGD